VHFRSLLLAALLVAVGVTLISALVAADDVGVMEYVGSAAIIAVLAFALFRLSRGAIRRA
jgi:hypothetical protein